MWMVAGCQAGFEEISQALLSKLYGATSDKDRERLVRQLDIIEGNPNR